MTSRSTTTPARTTMPAFPAESATPKSRRDFAVAQQITARLALSPHVEAIAVGGSIARGIGDEFSDLDLYAYCSAFPSESERRELLDPIAPTHWKSHQELAQHGILVDSFLCGDTEVDLNIVLLKTVEACLHAVLVKHDVTQRLQAFVGGFVDAVPLYGEPLCETWRARVSAYPDPLAHEMVRKHLRIEPLWVPGLDGCREGDLFVLYEALCRVQRGVLGILLGLNRLYAPPSYKRSRQLLASMAIKPDDAAARLEQVFTLEPTEALASLRAITEETFDLVGVHRPEFDVALARKRFTTNPALADEP